MSVLYPLIQALVLFAVAPLLSGITRVARALSLIHIFTQVKDSRPVVAECTACLLYTSRCV